MLKTAFTFIAFLGLLSASCAQIIFVKEGATGTGNSWEDATGDLQKALIRATPGTEIWVASGTYYPVDCHPCSEADRSVAFQVPDGIRLLGGFKGNEHRHQQRDWQKNPTTLSGNIGNDEMHDNSYTVIYTKNVSEETVIDGFIITQANANADAVPGDPSRSGGGWYNDGAGYGNRSNPFIMNCVFLDNRAIEGAALFNNGDNGESSPSIVECIFSGNQAHYGGGGIFNHGRGGTSRPDIEFCQFVNNEAAFGAGVFTACSDEEEMPEVKLCTFVNNKAQRGGGLFYLGLSFEPQLRNSRFLNNQSEGGEDIFVMKGKTIPAKLLAGIETPDDRKM